MILIKLQNYKSSVKRVRPILACIRNLNIKTAKNILLMCQNKKVSITIVKMLGNFSDEDIIEKAYATVALRKNKIIKMSHGSFHREKTRNAHIFLDIIKKEVK